MFIQGAYKISVSLLIPSPLVKNIILRYLSIEKQTEYITDVDLGMQLENLTDSLMLVSNNRSCCKEPNITAVLLSCSISMDNKTKGYH